MAPSYDRLREKNKKGTKGNEETAAVDENRARAHHAVMAETELEMARRHVADAERRVVRQEQIIAEMVRDNHAEAADAARRLLDTMRFHLKNAIAHLDRLETGSHPMPAP
jgi:hypothetical protein